MEISIQDIQKLRELTGSGMMDAKRALTSAKGDLDAAVKELRRAGMKIAEKKQDRATKQGLVGHYVHTDGKIAALVAVACETDFVARTDDFVTLAHDLALHVAAMNPLYIDPEQVPSDIIEKEKTVYREQMIREGKPAHLVDKIIEGKIQTYYSAVCLMRQPFVKDDSKTVGDLVKEYVAKLGENIRITNFSRLGL